MTNLPALPICEPPPPQAAASPEINLAEIRSRLHGAGNQEYWKSLEQLADLPAFQEMLQREFPRQVGEFNDVIGRRTFLKLMAASLALAGATGCVRQPEEKIVPYVRAPEGMVPGQTQYFATAVTLGGYAQGVLVESHEGRPTKVEGNPEHPASLGATDIYSQASILGLYDPDRSQTVMNRGNITTWAQFIAAVQPELLALEAVDGAGLHILTETVTSPTLANQLDGLLKKFPKAEWHQYEPVSRDEVRDAARRAFGTDVETIYHFERADIVVSLDADFLIGLPGSTRYARQFMSRRRLERTGPAMNRLYVAESTLTCTGSMADHRIRLRAGQMRNLAVTLAARLDVPQGLPQETASSEHSVVPSEWLAAVVNDLKQHRGASIVVAGDAQPAEVHALVHALNAALGNVGKTVEYIAPVVARPVDQMASLRALTQSMHGARVRLLVMLGGNPVYNAPVDFDFAGGLAKVALSIHLADYYDETSFSVHWHVPAAHVLESWSDARAFDGTATIIQPLIAPLYGGKTPHEVVAVLQGAPQASYDIVQAYWKSQLGPSEFLTAWNKSVHDGIVPGTQAKPKPVRIKSFTVRPSDERVTVGAPASDGVEIHFRPDPTIWDGRFANNGWLQELPKPITKLTWDNVAHVSPATAERLGLSSGDVVSLRSPEHPARSIRAPVWVLPGQADDCITLTFGYGRTRAGRIGTGIGYNACQIRSSRAPWIIAQGDVTKTTDKYPLVSTQDHQTMEGRDIVRVQTLDDYKHSLQAGADGHHGHDTAQHATLLPQLDTSQSNAWGMVIDQTSCIGCNACIVACQAENNTPIIGKEEVAFGRHMHWLRVDHYYQGDLDNPESYFQPVPCMHCENAPCELVCPVGATVHGSEGLNEMVYNRCVGTRYCSNNCPYKVRRFNFLQYSDQTTPSLKLLNNPDVTVRTRGVMEKCTYCIQRISEARISAKVEDRPIRDGEVVTACQQVCPVDSIIFGNLKDPGSRVNRLKSSPLNYGLLEELATKPRTTYLERVRNPHPDLASSPRDPPQR